MPDRESDMLIVVMKQGNACGAKGRALLRKDKGKHYPDTEQEEDVRKDTRKMETKLSLITSSNYPAK